MHFPILLCPLHFLAGKGRLENLPQEVPTHDRCCSFLVKGLGIVDLHISQEL